MAERFLGGDPFGPHMATGTPECCVCPVCRGIAALRDPSPEFAARVATGASDVAAGLTAILRAFSSASPAAAEPSERRPPAATEPSERRPPAATEPSERRPPAATEPSERRPPANGGPTWHAATHDADWPEPATGEEPEDGDPWHAATTATPPPRKMAKKAVRQVPPPEGEAQA
jgi:hypothetical protein